ncbi:hypothetical protein ACFVJS_10585 [Nocardioides sp. NPDC057772]|uniref:hypothetical protein n=1 Tax=unclassified Nocardioides TaxID=2615069 RepID=UPI0002028CA4|nr:hypothetical protein [Nocardioides sp. NBC_00368]EGD42844.1 hypothetical protein NBCG_02978 [Nocardioidaceae bacterium Broad-1]
MTQLLYSVAILACPVGMGLMMFFMMRRSGGHTSAPPANEQELARLRAELDQLKAAQRDAAARSDLP